MKFLFDFALLYILEFIDVAGLFWLGGGRRTPRRLELASSQWIPNAVPSSPDPITNFKTMNSEFSRIF